MKIIFMFEWGSGNSGWNQNKIQKERNERKNKTKPKTNIWRECCTSITNMSSFRRGSAQAPPTTTESTCIWKSLIICLQKKSAREKKKTAVSFLNLQHRMKLYIYIYIYILFLFITCLVFRFQKGGAHIARVRSPFGQHWHLHGEALSTTGGLAHTILHHLHLEYLQNKKVNKKYFIHH